MANAESTTDTREGVWLLIDDRRKHHNADVTVRTALDACRFLRDEYVSVLLLDYDLGIDQETGLEIIKWAELTGNLPPYIHIVSTHSGGVPRIQDFLKSRGFVFFTGTVMLNGKALSNYWRQLRPGEEPPRKKVTVCLKR